MADTGAMGHNVWGLGYNLYMDFEWHSAKAITNLQKHGVSFEEAKSVFSDEHAVIFVDEAHSALEPRELLIGHSSKSRLLLVSFTERSGSIRIISARTATRQERKDYEENTQF